MNNNDEQFRMILCGSDKPDRATLSITKEFFEYKGVKIYDAGAAYDAFMEFMRIVSEQ
jgi:hypothetical protein